MTFNTASINISNNAQVDTGSRVLLVGGKGGYINSLVAQIVGINGKVVTVSANQQILNTCKQRVEASPFKQIMEWRHLSSVQDTRQIKDMFMKVCLKYFLLEYFTSSVFTIRRDSMS